MQARSLDFVHPTVTVNEVTKNLEKYANSKIARTALRVLLRKDRKTKRTLLEDVLSYLRHENKRYSALVRMLSIPLKHYLSRASEAVGVSYKELLDILEPPWAKKIIASILKGFLAFGVRRPFTPGAPFLVVWDFTYRCNLRCKHCYSCSGAFRKNEMSVEERLKVVDILADAGVAMLALSGGEPLLGPGFWDVLKRANDYGMYLALATNGTLITDEVARKLSQHGLIFAQVSLDSPYPKFHDEFRGVKGAWERTVRGIKNLKKYGITVEVSMTVTKENYKQLPEMIRFVKEELKADMFMAFNFVPIGRGKQIVALDLTPEERYNVLKFLASVLYTEFNVASTAPQFSVVTYEFGKEAGKRIIAGHFYGIDASNFSEQFLSMLEFLGGCGAGRLYCAIEPDGSIQPCVFLPVKVGNILKDNFEKLWRSNSVLEALRDRNLLKGECSTCKYKFICGGCRARAYAYFNDYLASDPGCVLCETSWRLVQSLFHSAIEA